MSVDICFWKSGSGSGSDLYESATEGEAQSFVPSAAVLEFREQLITRWSDLEDSVEPLAYDPDLDEQEDLSRFVLITLHASQGDRLGSIMEMARSCGLTGYDSQIGEDIS